MKTIFILTLLVLFSLSAEAVYAGIDIAVTGNVGFQHGTLDSGLQQSLTGKETDDVISWMGSAQIIYSKWKWKPTAEFSYSRGEFDFRTVQAPIQYVNLDIFSVRLGVTRDFKLLQAYGLVGYSWIWSEGSIYERRDGRWLYHGKPTVKDRGFSFKLGAYRLFDVYKEIKLGPEVNIEVFPAPLGFSRCRNFGSGYIHPWLGVRLQY
jgi:hypothetical protein